MILTLLQAYTVTAGIACLIGAVFVVVDLASGPEYPSVRKSSKAWGS